MSTDARELAARYYAAAHRDPAADAAALERHPHGIIVWMPALTALLKPVRSDRPETWEDLTDIPADADAWYIHLLTGDLGMARRMAAALPPLRYACFRRGRRNTTPHRLPWKRLIGTADTRNT